MPELTLSLSVPSASGNTRISPILFPALGASAKPTRKEIMAVITQVSKWKTAAECLQTEESKGKMEEMEQELKRLMAAIGAQTIKPTKKTSM